MKPSKKDIQTWIDALRSGEYKQTKQALQDSQGYCCLGVACLVFISEENQLKNEGGYLFGGNPKSQEFAPSWLKDVNDDVREMNSGTSLMFLNDELGASFNEIADLLQRLYIDNKEA